MQQRRRALWLVVLMLIGMSGLMVPNPRPLQAETQRRLLYEGMRGDDVRWVQERLRWWGYYKGAVDGIYGRRTTAAVRYFQRKNGLRQDGAVGPQTWAALGRPVPEQRQRPPAAQPGYRSNDLNLLARLVHGEARGESYLGKVAVAAVILNRVRDSRFPNSVQEVVYQPGAFESVSNGQIYRQPDSEDLRAARDALNGWDPTRGAVFFWNPAKPVTNWIWSRPIIRQIGRHVFAR